MDNDNDFIEKIDKNLTDFLNTRNILLQLKKDSEQKIKDLQDKVKEIDAALLLNKPTPTSIKKNSNVEKIEKDSSKSRKIDKIVNEDNNSNKESTSNKNIKNIVIEENLEENKTLDDKGIIGKNSNGTDLEEIDSEDEEFSGDDEFDEIDDSFEDDSLFEASDIDKIDF